MVWLSSDSPTFGEATFSLSEVTANGVLKEVTRIEGYAGVNPKFSDYSFAIAGVNATGGDVEHRPARRDARSHHNKAFKTKVLQEEMPLLRGRTSSCIGIPRSDPVPY